MLPRMWSSCRILCVKYLYRYLCKVNVACSRVRIKLAMLVGRLTVTTPVVLHRKLLVRLCLSPCHTVAVEPISRLPATLWHSTLDGGQSPPQQILLVSFAKLNVSPIGLGYWKTPRCQLRPLNATHEQSPTSLFWFCRFGR